jgi:hypothetical protein
MIVAGVGADYAGIGAGEGFEAFVAQAVAEGLSGVGAAAQAEDAACVGYGDFLAQEIVQVQVFEAVVLGFLVDVGEFS